MTKRAKYTITDLFANASRGTDYTNSEILNALDQSVSLKTVQNVTSGLKQHGGLTSTRSNDGELIYKRTSKAKVLAASEFIF